MVQVDMTTTPPSTDDTVAAVVLAGGGSTRFGSDKSAAQWRGATLLESVLGVVTPLVDEVVVVGPWAPPGVRNNTEPVGGLGPLAGLVHGLSVVASPVALVVAVDHPALQPALCQLLIDRLRHSSVDAVVPVGPDGLEPLVAAYRTSLVAHGEALLASGERRVRAVLGDVSVELLAEERWSSVDPQGWSFRDADRPDELDRLDTEIP